MTDKPELLPCPFCGGNAVMAISSPALFKCSNINCCANDICTTAPYWNKREAVQAAQAVPVVGAAVAWYYRDGKDSDATTYESAAIAWVKYGRKVMPCYKKPTNSITAAELERLRKDVELKASEASIACEALQEIIDLLPDSSVAQAKLIAVAAMTKRAAIQRTEANIAPDPYTGGAAPDPDMAHAAHCSDAACVRCAAFDAGEKK